MIQFLHDGDLQALEPEVFHDFHPDEAAPNDGHLPGASLMQVLVDTVHILEGFEGKDEGTVDPREGRDHGG